MENKTFYILLLLIVGCSILPASAQDTLDTDERFRSRLNLGFRAGGTLSFIIEPNSRLNDNFIDPAPRLEAVQGFTAGVSAQYYAKSNFGLQVGVNYAEKGWQQEYIAEVGGELRQTDSIFFRQQLNYIDIPIMAHGYIGRRNFRIYLEAGIFVSYLFSHSSEQNLRADDLISYQFVDGRDERLGIGIVGGGGFEIVTAVGIFQLGGRYNLTYSSVIDKNIHPVPNPLLMNSIKITLGYYIPFS